MEFLELLENVRAEEASAQRLYSGEGRRITGTRPGSPEYARSLSGAAKLIADVIGGKKHPYKLQEALTTSDFPILFGDILDRQVLAAYREWPTQWNTIARRRLVRDFRPTKLYKPLTGADGRLDAVGELEEYPESTLAEQPTQLLTVKKFGRRMMFSWETIINDDVSQLTDTPERFGRAARRTESRMATELFVGVNGPSAAVYSVGNKNIINILNGASANNPPLTIAGLQDGLSVFSTRVDETGEPIFVEAVTLVVPPSLEVVANNILNATQLEITAALYGGVRDGGAGEVRLMTANWLRSRVKLVVDPTIPLIATTANAKTSWFLFADPSVGRPAMMMLFLSGYEDPQTFIKEPNARRVGGGPVDPMSGDFDNDAITYKVRHVVGSAVVDPTMTVASNGTGA